MNMIAKPEPSEYNAFYQPYISQISEGNIVDVLRNQLDEIVGFFYHLSDEEADYRYAEGKWSIKEVLNHLNDTERVFAYRALNIARGDQNELPGMDQDVYQDNSRTEGRSLASLVEEFKAIRVSTIALFDPMTEEDSLKSAIASGSRVSVRALAAMIAGHYMHHVEVIKSKYL